MDIASTRRGWSALFVCLVVGLGVTVSGCDSGGTGSGGESGPSSTVDDVNKVGETATVAVKESSSSKLASKAASGIVTVLFFYGENSDGSTCFSSASTEVSPPTTKKISPGTPDCASGPKTGISVTFVSLGGSSSTLTLELRGDDGSIVASASSSDGEVNVEGGDVPSDDSGSEDGDSSPNWTGTWVVTSFGNQQVSNREAYRITESRWTGVFKTQDGGCDSFSDPIINRDPSKNQITTLRDDGRTPTYEMSTSGGTLTAKTVGSTNLPNITADTTANNLADEINCTIDTEAPPSPSGLTSAAGSGYVTLNWNRVNSSGPVGYYIYRSTSQISDVSTLTPINSVTTNTAFADTSVTGGTTYYYAVTAVDANLNESAASSSVSATPTDSGSDTSSNWTGDWKVTEFYYPDVDTAITSRDSLYYSISQDQFTLVSRDNPDGGCDVEKSLITNVDGSTVTIGTTDSTSTTANFQVSSGTLTISVLTPPDQAGTEIVAESVSSDPREILNCSTNSTKSIRQTPTPELWGF
jgi:hypothetical protein